MVKNIVFDIGNVLADFCWKEFLHNKGLEGELFDRVVRASIKSKDWVELDRGTLETSQVIDLFVQNDPEIESTIRSVFEDFKNMVVIRDYAVSWVIQLKQRGYHVYYLSNFALATYNDCHDALAFTEYMDGGVFSCFVNLIKPDEAIYLELLKKYGLKSEECVFLDDNEPNIEAAQKLGFYGIVFKEKEQAEKELERILSIK